MSKHERSDYATNAYQTSMGVVPCRKLEEGSTHVVSQRLESLAPSDCRRRKAASGPSCDFEASWYCINYKTTFVISSMET